jgi:membrane-associated phospholipid phosphatase
MQWLPWPDAAVAAVGTAAATRGVSSRATSRLRPVASWTRELSVMFALYALWQLAGGLSLGRAADAVRRGRAVVKLERWMHLPGEASWQRPFLGDHGLLRAMDAYYLALHVAVTGACLVWVFARHRDRYPRVRNTLALATGACLAVALIPVAPPRLVPGLGVVDVARVVGPDVYPATDRPGLDQLSAMPSVHVAWAVIAAGAVVYVLRSPWRWAAVLYPVATLGVVVVTGNHYFLDGIVALVIVVAAAAVTSRMPNGTRPASWRRPRRRSRSEPGSRRDSDLSSPVPA